MANREHEWQTVARGKRSPATSLHPNPYTPYFNKPLYSQIVQTTTQAPFIPKTQPCQTAMSPPTPPDSPPPTKATYYFSPHSPTKLRFPPSSHFPEWRGRCFRCCRQGHNAAACRNPLRCGKCWGEGHMGTKCTAKTLNPAAMPYWSNKQTKPATAPNQGSPFEELLRPSPQAVHAFPVSRPKRLEYYVSRDAAT